MNYTARKLAIGAAIALTTLPLLMHPWSTMKSTHMPLFTPESMLASLAVYGLVVMSAFNGIYRKGRVLSVALCGCTLAGAIFDARLAPIFAVVAAPLLAQREHS